MYTLICTLGLDPEDATLNRPVLTLRPPEVADLLPLLASHPTPTLATLLAPDGPPRRALGIRPILALRAELQAILINIAARRLPSQLVLALTLQRLDTACATAQEIGLNLYATLDPE